MIALALFLVRILKTPIELLGVDYRQFEILLRTKLTIDFRTGPSAFQTSGRAKQTLGNQLIIFAIFGLFFGFVSLSVGDLLLSMTIFLTIMMVMLAMTLISEFTTVLFDHRDNQILLPRPVSNRTLLLVRLAHVLFYIGYIALALSVATGVIVAVKYKLMAALLYFIAVGLGTWLTLASTTFLYLLISRIVNPERFKDILTYLQIIFAILIFAGYQFLPRIVDEEALKTATLPVSGWVYIFPPTWLAALVKLSQLPDISTPEIILSVLAVIVPLAGAFLLIRFLSRGFGVILGEGSVESSAPVNQKSKTTTISDRIINFFCVSAIEKAAWMMAISTTNRDRKFKEAVYPQLGMLLVFGILILKPDLKNPSVSLHETSEFPKYFFLIIFGFAGTLASLQLPYTDTPEAAWIYMALPVKERGHILTGAVKSMLMRFFVPLFSVIAVFTVWLWGINLVPQIMLSFCGIIMLTLMAIIIQKMDLPFTQQREMQRKGSSTITAILNMILMGILSGLVYGTTFIPLWATTILFLLLAGLDLFLFKKLRGRKV